MFWSAEALNVEECSKCADALNADIFQERRGSNVNVFWISEAQRVNVLECRGSKCRGMQML